jgi:multiple sugar transport system permease protein
MNIKRNRGLGDRNLGYKMILPASILIIILSLYPLLNGFYLSMMDYNLLKPNDIKFVWFDNFIQIITSDKEFYSVLGYSFVYTISVVLISYIIGLILALLLNRDIKFRGLFRALVLIPWVVPPVVAATNWSWVLNDQVGIINNFLESINLIDKPILFLGTAEMARVTVILTSAWKSFPFMMIVLLAGLEGIPSDLYEAAYIDGAGFIKSFLHITMPMIRNVSLICTTLMFIWTFNNFENIYLLTRGGPSQATFVLPILSYYTAFFRSEIGYASAISVILLVVLLIISLSYLRLQRNED